jgi:uncharacterized protein (DUF849 family)
MISARAPPASGREAEMNQTGALRDRIIVEAAVSGFGGKKRNPNNPVGPAETAAAMIACFDAGASIVHNHIDDYKATGTAAAAIYGDYWAPVFAARPDAFVYGTLSGGGDTPLDRFSHVLPTIERYGSKMGAIDVGSNNLTAGSPDGLPNTAFEFVNVNSYATIDHVLRLYAKHDVPVNMAVWDPTFLRATLAYQRAGLLHPGSFVKLYFGGDRTFLDGRPGLGFGLPPTVRSLETYLDMMAGSGLNWAVGVIGGDLGREPDLVRATIAHGGHLRVGLEDYGGARDPGNGELVAEIVALAKTFGRTPASPAEAAEILGIRS